MNFIHTYYLFIYPKFPFDGNKNEASGGYFLIYLKTFILPWHFVSLYLLSFVYVLCFEWQKWQPLPGVWWRRSCLWLGSVRPARPLEEEEAIEVTVQESSETRARAGLSQTRQWEILTPGPGPTLDTGTRWPGPEPLSAAYRDLTPGFLGASGLEKMKIQTKDG